VHAVERAMMNERNTIKRALRQAFPGVKFSVTREFPIRVHWPDEPAGPTESEVETGMLATGLVEVDPRYGRTVLRFKNGGSDFSLYRYDAARWAALAAERQAAIDARGLQPGTVTARLKSALRARFGDRRFTIESSHSYTGIFTFVSWCDDPLDSEVEAIFSELFGDEARIATLRTQTCPICSCSADPDGKGGLWCGNCEATVTVGGAVA
jgi:hypothetical protein